MHAVPHNYLTLHHEAFFASCPLGLESLLEAEIKKLNVKSTRQAYGGVEFIAYNEKVIELLFTSRIASRVFKKYFSIKVKSSQDLFQKAKEIDWKTLFNVEKKIKVQTHLGRMPRGLGLDKNINTLFISQLLKDAIVDRFRSDLRQRPSVDLQNPDVTIYCHLSHLYPDSEHASTEDLQADILFDLCGDPLSDRGYRPLSRGFGAPLRENLAAGILSFMDWKPQSEIFIDQMCGSGTMLAEAYLWAKKIPPAYNRIKIYAKTFDFLWGFQHLSWFTKNPTLIKDFNKLIEKYFAIIEENIAPSTKHTFQIVGLDLDGNALHFCENLIHTLEAQKKIIVMQKDATKYSPPYKNNLCFANPPYGARLLANETAQLEKLYFELGENWKKNFKGSRSFLFTGNMELLKKVSLKTAKKWILFNGPIEARLAQYNLY